MSDTIDKATEAFERAIAPVTKQQAKAESDSGEVDRMFDHDHEGGVGGDGDEHGDEEAEGFDEDVGSNSGDDGEGDEDPGEAEGDEDEEGEDDDESDEHDGDDDSGKGLDDQHFTVLVDGEEQDVSLREALEGYIRTKTFHQRMQKVHEAAEMVNKGAIDLEAKFAEVDKLYAEAEEFWKAALPDKEPDWDRMYAEDPQNARAVQKQWDAYKAKIDEIKAARKDAADSKSGHEQQNIAQYAKAEKEKFVAKNPQWKTQQDVQRDLSAMATTARNLGFSEEEIGGVLDHRMLMVLLKASKYDRMMASRPKAAKPGQFTKKPQTDHVGSKATRPGKAAPQGNLPKGVRQAQQRLNKTGSVDDAAAVFQNIIGR